ncbi:leucyl/phenylalanyl-tRNA--protein transferase [Baekduia soli]|uniref:Leucyl/phenylalanyl-tRNA--protein transferase n=1 Tax=Baekduia soli TaxID=496014 RepID=A0A5B8U3D5_9ACTN|nr:leucyl/phenylalanyl-tRNA--protein transferase [Baekduia soli]QEC47462.1 leucyl/phenylalanyl-tRNA--protein transferase [Baekduia soli]
MDVATILGLYAQGLFPMDEPGAPDLPWWAADPRTVFGLDAPARAGVRRRVRRSLAAREGWELRVDGAFDEVVTACARPRGPHDGVWLTPRMHELYRALHAAGHAHTFEVWLDDGLAAGLVGVTIGRAAMLESMFHRVPHAGNVLVSLTLDALAASGYELCDIQTATDHTLFLGAVQIPREEYERRLCAALG